MAKTLLDLGPFAQMPMTRTYTIVTLIFPLKDQDEDIVISTLTKAANEMVLAYPWLTGQIVIEVPAGEEGSHSGIVKVVEYEQHEGPSKFLHVKDCRELCPSYAELIKAHAPSSMLDGAIISPAYGFPNEYPPHVLQPAMLVQANLVKGGLLLTIAAHHCTMDANGDEHFILQFASLCRGEKLLEEHIRMGNADQHTIIPPLEPGAMPADTSNVRQASTLNTTPAPKQWPPPRGDQGWSNYRFTASKIVALKSEASKAINKESNVPFISSNDAVTAFIWSAMIRARQLKLGEGKKSMLGRTVNSRQRLNPPMAQGYFGHAIVMSFTSLPVEEVIDHNHLSQNTIAMRKSLLAVDDHLVRSFFAMLSTEKDKTTVSYSAAVNHETDLVITSFVAQKLYTASWGDVLGLPELVRRPELPMFSCCYMLPLSRDGDIDVLLGLTSKEYEVLKGDELWNSYAEAFDPDQP